MTVKRRKTKKKEELRGNLCSGVLFIGDCRFFSGSPVIELDPTTGQMVDVTPKDPLNPFNTMDRISNLSESGDKNMEILPHIPGRGVLLNTHLQDGYFTVKKKMKDGKVVGYTIDIKG